MTKEPIRTCVVCGARRAKAELLRVTFNSGLFQLDVKHVIAGRGSYLCIDKACGVMPQDVKALRKAFKTGNVRQLLELLQRL